MVEAKTRGKYDIKTQVIGHGAKDVVEGKVLNRIIRATDDGWELEADPRHAELLAEQLGVESGKGLSTPGIPEGEEQRIYEVGKEGEAAGRGGGNDQTVRGAKGIAPGRFFMSFFRLLVRAGSMSVLRK